MITLNGLQFVSSLPNGPAKRFFTIAYNTKNHNAKLAKFFIIFQSAHKLESKCKKDQYTISLVINLPARVANNIHTQDATDKIRCKNHAILSIEVLPASAA